MIVLTYRNGAAEQTYEFASDRLDELLRRADAKFLPAWTKADEARFQRILAADRKRRGVRVGK